MAKCNQLTSLPFKGLTHFCYLRVWYVQLSLVPLTDFSQFYITSIVQVGQ